MVHNIYVYDDNGDKVKINPTTEASGVSDLGAALDAYKTAFIDPELDELDRALKYNAIHSFDATVVAAPQNLVRGRAWHVDMIGNLIGTYQYRRYFYLYADDAMLDIFGSPNLPAAVARWCINGKEVYFEYLNAGAIVNKINITDANGVALLDTFYPIQSEVVWYFGSNQADPFPTSDNLKSIIDINARSLFVMIGNNFNLQTANKEIVEAINELLGLLQSKPAASDVVMRNQNVANAGMVLGVGSDGLVVPVPAPTVPDIVMPTTGKFAGMSISEALQYLSDWHDVWQVT